MTPVRRSLLRKIAWLGADRRIVGMAALISATLGWTMVMGFGILYGLSIAIPGFLFTTLLWVGRDLYAKDPWMIDVALRHFKYRKYYGARADLGVQHPPIKDFC